MRDIEQDRSEWGLEKPSTTCFGCVECQLRSLLNVYMTESETLRPLMAEVERLRAEVERLRKRCRCAFIEGHCPSCRAADGDAVDDSEYDE